MCGTIKKQKNCRNIHGAVAALRSEQNKHITESFQTFRM